jgi:hypothetical protein
MRYQAPPRTVVNTKAIAAMLMTAVASQPNVLLNLPLVCSLERPRDQITPDLKVRLRMLAWACLMARDMRSAELKVACLVALCVSAP